MCATPDKATTEEFRNRTGRQRAYKVIYKATARPETYTNSGVRYRPGLNVDRNPVKTYHGYARGCERGFHCYLSRKVACYYRDGDQELTVVCVTFEPSDVIVAEGKDDWGPCRQIVVRALHISKRAWKQAGLPATKGGGA